MQDAAVLAQNLSIVRNKKNILNNLSFELQPGVITGLIGPSGSGKTTLMRAIVGAQQISSGKLGVLGKSAGHKELRDKLGYVTQSPAVYKDLTVYQNLRYFASVLGCDNKDIENVIDKVDLKSQASQLVGSLSGGQEARVSLAIALLGKAEILVLDEPTVGLDPLLRKDLWDLFKQLATGGTTLIISSHVMEEAELCEDIMLLRNGRILSHGPKDELLQTTNAQSVLDAFMTLITKGESDAS